MGNVVSNVGRVERLEEVGNIESEAAHSLSSGAGHEDILALELTDHSVYSLNKRDPRFQVWKSVIDAQQADGSEVYVEADSATNEVREIFSPLLRRVHAVGQRPVGGRVAVALPPTPTPCFLNTAHPHYQDFRKLLETARLRKTKVLVTVNPLNDEVVDVREPSRPGLPRGPADAAPEAMTLLAFVPDLTPISPGRADSMFAVLQSDPVIPFDYLKNCCAARAHRMCERMRRRDIESAKIWNYGHGYVDGPAGPNGPADFTAEDCTLTGFHEDTPDDTRRWLYHVAPVVAVRVAGVARFEVLDPSMFNSRRPAEEWLAQLRDDRARQAFSPPRVSFRDPDGGVDFDDDFSETEKELGNHRNNRDRLRLL